MDETPEQVEHVRMEYAASLSMYDAWLGKVLNLMDEYDMWDDTMLIVNTDNGFLLGEHDWWAKCVQPLYGEVAHSPLFIWDPRCQVKDARRASLTQTVDLPATLLEHFELPLPPDMQAVPLKQTVADDTPVREAALFGLHGGHVNVRDGWPGSHPYETLLFDLETDPGQERTIGDPDVDPAAKRAMLEHLVRLMKENDAPPEQHERLALDHVPARLYCEQERELQ